MTDISIIIPALNAAPTLARLFSALQRAQEEFHGTTEVILVDNGSTDSTVELATKAGARVLRCSTPGPGAARNMGLGAATGELLLLMDADCAPEHDWLVVWHQLFSSDSELMLAGGFLVDAETDSLVGKYTAYHGILNAEKYAFERKTRPGFFLTANFALRRSILKTLGNFDETMYPAGEDADLCWRADEMGLKRAFCAQARVQHFHRSSFLGLARQMYKYGYGAATVQAKWGKRLGFDREIDYYSWYMVLRGFVKLVVSPFLYPKSWRRLEGILDIVRYSSFTLGRWRGAIKHRVVCL